MCAFRSLLSAVQGDDGVAGLTVNVQPSAHLSHSCLARMRCRNSQETFSQESRRADWTTIVLLLSLQGVWSDVVAESGSLWLLSVFSLPYTVPPCCSQQLA